jgi:outer membrane lipoprotein SlyB
MLKLQSKTKRNIPPDPTQVSSPAGLLQRKATCSNYTNGGLLAIVPEVLHAPGQPLDQQTHALMQSHFGRDFSRVRIHTDRKAAISAKALNAAAYTVGREVVFGTGRYSPHSAEGKRLLAHELTHVIQQRDADVGQSLQLGTAENACEQSAVEMEARFVESPMDLAVKPVSGEVLSGRTVQRSLLGGILSAVAGAAGGALVGGFVGGPLGAILGGVAGFVGGALIGDKATTRSRKLSLVEIAYATEIFKDSLDYSKVSITRDSLISTGATKTVGNTIHLRSAEGDVELFKGDSLELTDMGMETLIHEMGHVRQYQNGGLAYIPESLLAQFKGAIKKGTRNAAYDWPQAVRGKLAWEDWNPEQQASAIERYNQLVQKSKESLIDPEIRKKIQDEIAILLPYMDKVWKRQGAPTFNRPRPAGSSGQTEARPRELWPTPD